MKTFALLACTAALLATTLPARADQPHMEAALKSLEAAKDSLQKASGDKGGHRSNALKSINAAIVEVKAGMAFDDSNKNKDEKAKAGDKAKK